MSEQTQDNNPRGALTGIFIALLSALFAALFYIGFTYLAYIKNKPMAGAQQVIVQVVSAAFAIGLTQFLFRQVQGNKLQFKQGFLGGWMASLMLGIFVAFYYNIFAKHIGNPLPKIAFAMVLMLYNLLGIIISFIFAFVLKKTN
jgi:hypothetical protein